MFEKIPFTDVFENCNANNSNIENMVDQANEKDYQMIQDAVSHTDFVTNGELRVLLGYPIGENFKRYFSYIQLFTDLQADSSHSIRRSKYPSYLLLFTKGGQGRLHYRGTSYLLKRDMLFFINCEEQHEYYTVGEFWHSYGLHIYGGNLPFIFEQFFQEQTPVFQLSDPEAYLRKLEHLLIMHTTPAPYRDYAVSQAIQNILLFLLETLNKQGELRGSSETITYLVKYMNNHFTKNLTIDELAQFAGLSKYHLSREFKKYTGFSIHDYLNELRISHAKTLLVGTDIPCYKVGILVGLPNENTFLRLFKEKVGMTPKEYREKTAGF